MMGHYAILSSPELRAMGLAALILSGFVSVAATAAELPKEGAFATTTYFHDLYDAVEAAPKSYMWTYDDYGIVTNDFWLRLHAQHGDLLQGNRSEH